MCKGHYENVAHLCEHLYRHNSCPQDLVDSTFEWQNGISSSIKPTDDEPFLCIVCEVAFESATRLCLQYEGDTWVIPCGFFVLEPLDEDYGLKMMKVWFEWVLKRTGPLTVRLDDDPSSFSSDSAALNTLFDYSTGQVVKTSDIITIQTSDPDTMLLLDKDLLRLQCLFIRVLRLAGRVCEDMLDVYSSAR